MAIPRQKLWPFVPAGTAAASARARRAADASRATPHCRRHRGDAAVADRLYSDDEREFLREVDVYQQRHGRLWPGDPAVLRVAAEMGYRRPAGGKPAETSVWTTRRA